MQELSLESLKNDQNYQRVLDKALLVYGQIFGNYQVSKVIYQATDRLNYYITFETERGRKYIVYAQMDPSGIVDIVNFEEVIESAEPT